MSSVRPAVRVVVADADALSLSGLQTVLSGDPAVDVVAVHASVAAVPTSALDADVAVLSSRSDPGPEFEVAAWLAGRVATVLVLPGLDAGTLARAVDLGVTGLLVHGRFDAVDLVRTVRGCAAGETHLASVPVPSPDDGIRPVLGGRCPVLLTVRETEIMELVSSGLSNAQVGHRLHLSEKTVKNVLTRVFAKLDASNRAHAAAVFLGRADLGRVS